LLGSHSGDGGFDRSHIGPGVFAVGAGIPEGAGRLKLEARWIIRVAAREDNRI
jgi:hypothetical protein